MDQSVGLLHFSLIYRFSKISLYLNFCSCKAGAIWPLILFFFSPLSFLLHLRKFTQTGSWSWRRPRKCGRRRRRGEEEAKERQGLNSWLWYWFKTSLGHPSLTCWSGSGHKILSYWWLSLEYREYLPPCGLCQWKCWTGGTGRERWPASCAPLFLSPLSFSVREQFLPTWNELAFLPECSAPLSSTLWAACRVEQRLLPSVNASWLCFCLCSFHLSVFTEQDLVLCFLIYYLCLH